MGAGGASIGKGAAALVGGISQLESGNQQERRSRAAVRGRRNQLRNVLFGGRLKGRNLADTLEKTFGEYLQSIETGYGRAEEELDNFGKNQRREIGLSTGQAQAATDKNLIGRGLFGTGVKEVADRGVRRDNLSANLALNERLSAVRSNLDVSKTNALAQFYGLRSSAETLPYTGYASGLSGLPIIGATDRHANFLAGAQGHLGLFSQIAPGGGGGGGGGGFSSKGGG